MDTRRHVVEIALPASPAEAFALLVTPSAIRGWWGAARAVVLPREGGAWAAAWGEAEDDPDYVSVPRIRVFTRRGAWCSTTTTTSPRAVRCLSRRA